MPQSPPALTLPEDRVRKKSLKHLSEMWTLSKTIEFHGWFDFYTLQNAQERTCRLRNEVYGWFLLNLITSCPRSSIWPLRTIDFPLRSGSSQMLGPDWECQWFGTENPCFSQLELFRILRIRFWELEITRIPPGKCQKPSGIIPYQEIHNRWKSKICFFLLKKKQISPHLLQML